MPLFNINNQTLQLARPTDFDLEKTLQTLIENNLEVVFNCRLVASEYSTGPRHGGRMDTLAISEDNNPVIIEYKKVESSQLVNQSLYYLAWLSDHRGDFEVACKQALGAEVEIDWGAIRVICLAPGYKKYDLHAVEMMGAGIELWQYRLYEDNSLYLEEIVNETRGRSLQAASSARRTPPATAAEEPAPEPNTLEQSPAKTPRTGDYSIEQHVASTPEHMRALMEQLREILLGAAAGEAEEAPRKKYIAYKIAQNYASLEVRQSKFLISFKLNPDEIELNEHMRDVRNIGHYGTGDIEYTVQDESRLDEVRRLAEKAVAAIGG